MMKKVYAALGIVTLSVFMFGIFAPGAFCYWTYDSKGNAVHICGIGIPGFPGGPIS